MPRKPLVQLLAALLLGTALALLAVFEPGRDDGLADRLSSTLAGQVKQIRIALADRPEVVLQRQDDRWRMLAPLDMPANPVRATALTTLTRAPAVRSYDLDEVSLAALGLDPPRVRLHLDDLRIDIGSRHPVEDLRYVRVGDRVHLLADRFYHHVSAAAAGHVDPSVLGYRPELAALDLPQVQLRHDATGWQWQPPTALASADQAIALVDRWRSASAVQVQALDLSLRWGRPVRVELRGGEQLVFMVARTADALFLGRRDVQLQYRLPAGRGAQLLDISPAGQAVQPATAGSAGTPAG